MDGRKEEKQNERQMIDGRRKDMKPVFFLKKGWIDIWLVEEGRTGAGVKRWMDEGKNATRKAITDEGTKDVWKKERMRGRKRNELNG